MKNDFEDAGFHDLPWVAKFRAREAKAKRDRHRRALTVIGVVAGAWVVAIAYATSPLWWR